MTRARGISLAVSAAGGRGGRRAAGRRRAGAGRSSWWRCVLHAVGVLATVRLLDRAAIGLGLSPVTPLAAVTAIFLPVVGPIGLGLLVRAVARGARAPRRGAAADDHATAGAAGGGARGRGRDAGDRRDRGAAALRARQRRARAGGAGDAPARRRARDAAAARGAARSPGGRAAARLRAARGSRAAGRRDRARAAGGAGGRAGVAGRRCCTIAWPTPTGSMCYQELVAGELESFALGRVLEHLDAASAAGGATAARWLLRARVLLRRGDAAGARAALDESRRAGMPARTVDPYLAEAAFVERRSGRARGGERVSDADAASCRRCRRARARSTWACCSRGPTPTSAAASRAGCTRSSPACPS